MPLAGRPMVEWSRAAISAAGIEDVVIAMPPANYVTLFGSVAAVPGGATRSESVRNAFAALPPCDAVVVHDAARPLAPAALFTAVLDALSDADAAIAAAPVADTVKRVEGGRVVETLDRSRLWAVQTPQAFRRDVLERALDVPDDVLAAATDDAWLVERAGGKVVVVEAPASNFKVTTPHALRVAELLLTSPTTAAP